MTALTEILAWSQSAPAWLRDALRRIVISSELSEPDIGELVELCKAPHGLSANPPTADLLSHSHVPAIPTTGAVSVSSITHVADVNALAPNEVLALAPKGLTIIYGDNGAGKSGFTRILRRACRARGGNEPILANAMSDKPAGAPTAKIEFTVAGVSREHTWRDGTAADPDLSAISVFDTDAAQVYVEEKTEVRFRPFGLDVTDRAAAACARVKKEIESERDAHRAQVATLPVLAPSTAAGKLIAQITGLTQVAEVDRLGTLNEEEQRELDTLTAALATARAEDPKKKAAEVSLRAERFRRHRTELSEIATALADDRVAEIARLAVEAQDAEKEAQRFAESLAKEVALAGVGKREWTALWDAARAYSETQAYVDHAFPHLGEGAACVLCQQELQAPAQQRMRRLAEFATGTVQAAARQKRASVDQARAAISAQRLGERSADTFAELQTAEPTVALKVGEFVVSATACQKDIVAGTPSPRRCDVPAPLAELDALIGQLESQAEALRNAADPAARAKSEARASELGARKALGAALPQVHAEIKRRARLNAYEQCLKDVDTRGLTKLGGELTKKYVTDALTKGFDAELTALGFTALELELKPASAQRGQLFHKLQLKHATRAELPKVVSEGESRCIALAAFMAELRSAGHESAIVFDDPVSSLDHRWRSSVARRLVEAARTRQVVVFTHELVFLAALLHEAELAGVPAETRTVARDREFAGHISAGLPWYGLPTKRRIGWLREQWTKADKVFRTEGQNAYDPCATRLYAELRQTWERAIEEVLLNQVVLRFRPGIETNRLKKLGDITPEDLDAVDVGMTKSSKWEGGHDQALAMNEHPPQPDELKGDIDALDQWVAAVDKRRR
jgi:energy-coupling factor transporter ATP-binding protein EcfA2